MPKSAIRPLVALYEGGFANEHEVDSTRSGNFQANESDRQVAERVSQSTSAAAAKTGTPLYEICLARSGDKGDTANIGVMARSPKAMAFLDSYLTAQRIKDWFQELCLGRVVRYRLDNMQGFNFLLENSLGGGGTLTLRADAQGKTFAQAVLRQKVQIPAEVLADVRLARDGEVV